MLCNEPLHDTTFPTTAASPISQRATDARRTAVLAAMSAPVDRERLAKLLGLLSSQHDGEVVAAARRADAMVRASGLTWRDVVVANDAQPQLDPIGFGVANEIRFCLLHRHHVNGWEQEFLASIRNQGAPLSARQRNCLNSIIDRLRVRAEAA